MRAIHVFVTTVLLGSLLVLPSSVLAGRGCTGPNIDPESYILVDKTAPGTKYDATLTIYYDNAASCSASPADTGDALVRAYTRYVNQHELGHSLYLVDDGGDHHHPPGDETLIMTPSPILTKKGSKVTFHLPYQFDASCRDNKALE